MAQNESSSLKVILAWLFVGLPLVWGVSQTIVKSLTLFQ
ncbi:MAG: oxalate:formate antiporter [Bacteroidota bacterium]